MTFINVQFPRQISQGAQGGPSYSTQVTITGSGVEQRTALWQKPRYRWNVSQNLKSPMDMYELQSFFNVAQGRLNSFRFKDWADYTDIDKFTAVHNGVFIDSSTGALTYDDDSIGISQMHKLYTIGSINIYRKITKPIVSHVVVYCDGVVMVEGVDYTLDYSSGVFTKLGMIDRTGNTLTWHGQFDVHARFDSDEMKFTQEASTVHSWSEIMVQEIRD